VISCHTSQLTLGVEGLLDITHRTSELPYLFSQTDNILYIFSISKPKKFCFSGTPTRYVLRIRITTNRPETSRWRSQTQAQNFYTFRGDTMFQEITYDVRCIFDSQLVAHYVS
jgi:hypothetical protein